MWNSIRTATSLAALSWCASFVLAGGAAKFDRSIAREPAYQSAGPKYGLLVFDRDARTRVWLVFDSVPDPLKPGEARDYLYVDRNGNGDLTDPGERIPAVVHKRVIVVSFTPTPQYEPLLEFDVGEVRGRDGKPRCKDLKVQVQWYRGKDRPCLLSAGANGRFDSLARVVFSGQPEDAPVLHFGGRFTLRLANGKVPSFSPGEPAELYAEIGTPGSGKGAFVVLGADSVPPEVHPVAQIEFPSKSPDQPAITTTVVLAGRC